MRITRAGVLFVTLPGPVPWAAFRDVWEVDGRSGGGFGVATVEATTRYSGYLRFSVTLEERVTGLPPKPR